MRPDKLYQRYRELQQYANWTEEDAQLVRSLAGAAKRHFAQLIDDFYDAIQRNPSTNKVITGGAQQIARLKGTLVQWLEELFSGRYDQDYVIQRWKVGLRHVEIGLDQVYANAALSRLRTGLLLALEEDSSLEGKVAAARRSLNKLLDLDLAIIEDAYQTERALLEDAERLEAERRRAFQNERLAAIGETMTALIHESRNALQRSTACLEMLSLEVQDRPAALDLVGRVQRAQEDLHRLYEEVRQYAAPVVLHRENCDLCHLWRDAWQNLAYLHTEKKLRLVEEVNNTNLECHVDPFAIGQVWRNVLENAVAATLPETTITVAAVMSRIQDQDAVAITLTDQGPGLTPEQQQRIFEPFFTTKTKGTGLGMAIVHRIVAAHGGTIAATSGLTGGAVIEVVLPRSTA